MEFVLIGETLGVVTWWLGVREAPAEENYFGPEEHYFGPGNLEENAEHNKEQREVQM